MQESVDAKAVAEWINSNRHKVGLTGAGGLNVVRAVFVEQGRADYDCIMLVCSHTDQPDSGLVVIQGKESL
jgi:hypothetical protein